MGANEIKLSTWNVRWGWVDKVGDACGYIGWLCAGMLNFTLTSQQLLNGLP